MRPSPAGNDHRSSRSRSCSTASTPPGAPATRRPARRSGTPDAGPSTGWADQPGTTNGRRRRRLPYRLARERLARESAPHVLIARQPEQLPCLGRGGQLPRAVLPAAAWALSPRRRAAMRHNSPCSTGGRWCRTFRSPRRPRCGTGRFPYSCSRTGRMSSPHPTGSGRRAPRRPRPGRSPWGGRCSVPHPASSGTVPAGCSGGRSGRAADGSTGSRRRPPDRLDHSPPPQPG
jgi:hypothetical protein